VRRALGTIRRRGAASLERARSRRRLTAIARAPVPPPGTVAVSYGRDRIPSDDEPVHGGLVKLQQLARFFPNEPRSFSVLYLGSSTRPPDTAALIEAARERGAAVVWNQDGVAYPGWHGPGWEVVNARFAPALHAADHVLFQSEFCRSSANRWLGERSGPAEVLHNPVDTSRFSPASRRPRPLTILLGGNQYQEYRVERALRTLAVVRRERPDARLVVAGSLTWSRGSDPDAAPRTARALVAKLGLDAAVEFAGVYTQLEAPALYRGCDLLLHPKYNDPCPTTVLEAMACGLPVVYSASGGTPELVGEHAGIGVPAPLDWQRDHPPSPEALAAAVLAVAERLPVYGEAARSRARRFDLRPWVERHRELFEELVR
jgi:glycosyltransferase involved in cell wall biosynthesis